GYARIGRRLTNGDLVDVVVLEVDRAATGVPAVDAGRGVDVRRIGRARGARAHLVVFAFGDPVHLDGDLVHLVCGPTEREVLVGRETLLLHRKRGVLIRTRRARLVRDAVLARLAVAAEHDPRILEAFAEAVLDARNAVDRVAVAVRAASFAHAASSGFAAASSTHAR